ncbi:MAG: PQQ-binding-like beta-propeller repeat protein, partial [Bacteroidota bacterium]
MKFFFINTFFSCLILISCKNSASNERIVIQVKDTLKNKSDSFVKKINYFFEPVVDSNFLVEKAQDYLLNRDDISYDLDEDNPEGIFSFRGGNLRNSPVRGTIDFVPKKVVKSWEFKTSMDSMNGKWGRWGGGAGWTGQPLVINWNEQELKNISTLKAEFKERKNLKEIVQVSLCGKVYFLDFETGKSTREPISIDNPIKGTPSIDSKKKNFLLLGQGIPHRGGFAWRCFNLKTNKLIHEEKMPDKFAFRKWGACDASPLIEPNSKTFVWPTESGVIYHGSLSENKLDSIEKYRYKSKETSHQGIESSPSAIGNLIYFTDNGGNVFCLDVKTMKPRWHYFNNDDSDATPAI